jgi:hypothetical protein
MTVILRAAHHFATPPPNNPLIAMTMVVERLGVQSVPEAADYRVPRIGWDQKHSSARLNVGLKRRRGHRTRDREVSLDPSRP